jgi:hypothetical protein
MDVPHLDKATEPMKIEIARRRLHYAMMRVAEQQKLVDELSCNGCDTRRARRVLADLRLFAQLLGDHVVQLELKQTGRGPAPAAAESRAAQSASTLCDV